MILVIKGVQVLLGPLYDYLDGRLLGHTLRKSEKARLQLREDKAQEGVELPGWKVHKPTTWIVCCQLGGMVVVSWVVSLAGGAVRSSGQELTPGRSFSSTWRRQIEKQDIYNRDAYPSIILCHPL